MVAVPARSWRPFARPVAFLLAVTAAVFGIRALAFPQHPAPRIVHSSQITVWHGTKYYDVRAGDTLAAVAAKTGVPAARLRQLNPKLQPTALFIGQRIRLR